VGNQLVSIEQLDSKNIDPYKVDLDERQFRELFGERVFHKFTGIDYLEYYKSLGDNIVINLSNNPCSVLKHTRHVIAANIHARERTKRILREAGAELVLGLDDILRESVNGSGYNSDYGLLGSNKADEGRVKLFPRNCGVFVKEVQELIKNKAGKHVEVLVYGDGAYKDPVMGIWELADPVVSPAYTEGLEGMPNELKLKYIADSKFKGVTGEELDRGIRKAIAEKDDNLIGKDASEGTTPRRVSDLLGSLCDLTSGSGDKGTPVVLIQGYFDNYADD
jgi:hypothetical protein